MAETKNSIHRSFRFPHEVDEALTQAFEDQGVTRSEYVIALLCSTLGVEEVTQDSTANLQSSLFTETKASVTHVTQEEFSVLQARVEALEHELRHKTPKARQKAPKARKAKKATTAGSAEQYEFKGRLGSIREHLEPIEKVLGITERRNAEKNISKKKRQGVSVVEAIEHELTRRLKQ